jgi:hypothetical protein
LLSEFIDNKLFNEMTRDDIISFLDSIKKDDSEDIMHKWIGSYNLRLTLFTRFFKWLYFQNMEPSKNHKVIDEGAMIVDALNGKILYQNIMTPKSYLPDFFSKTTQDPLDKDEVLNDIEEISVIHDLLNITPEFHYEARRTSKYILEVLEPKLPAKAAKSMILEEIIENNTKNISYKKKFADGRTEDREMRIIPKQSEIRIASIALVYLPKWTVKFKAKEVIYTRKILAASNTKLMNELEYCPKHFSRWKVWQGKKATHAICDTCGAAYCEDHLSTVNNIYYCEEHKETHYTRDI